MAANAIAAVLLGEPRIPAEFTNTCWSLLASGDAVKVGAAYEATEEKIAEVSGFISQMREEAAVRRQTYEESLGWYAGITSDMFG